MDDKTLLLALLFIVVATGVGGIFLFTFKGKDEPAKKETKERSEYYKELDRIQLGLDIIRWVNLNANPDRNNANEPALHDKAFIVVNMAINRCHELNLIGLEAKAQLATVERLRREEKTLITSNGLLEKQHGEWIDKAERARHYLRMLEQMRERDLTTPDLEEHAEEMRKKDRLSAGHDPVFESIGSSSSWKIKS
jgi:hypothetical protein